MDRQGYDLRRLELMRRTVTRREVLKGGAAGFAAVSFGGVIAACGGERGGDDNQSGTTAAGQQTPAKGGTLVFAVDALTGNSDPGIFATFGDWMAIDCIGRGLTHIDYRTTEVKPALAERWEVSRDGLVYRFQLRQGLTFHDGNPVTARDCARTFNRLIDEKDPSRPSGTYAIAELGGTNVRTATAISELEFELRLKDPDVAFLARLSNPNGVILSAAAIEKYGKRIGNQLVAAGPFKFSDSTPGQKVSLVAFDDYWEGRPPLDRVVLQVLPDASSLTSALQNGSVQASNFLPQSNVPQLKKSGRLQIFQPKSYISIFLQMNAGVPLLKDLKVRQAINLALDREAILKEAFFGLGELPAYMVAPPELGYDESLKRYSTQDMVKAKQLLAEAGATGKRVDTIHQNVLFWPKVGQVVNANLEELGLKVRTQFVDVGTFSAKQFDPKGHEIATWQRSAFVPDPDNKLSPLLASGTTTAEGITQNNLLPTQAKLDQMLIKAREEPDDNRRKELYVELQRFLAEDIMVYAMLATIFTPVAGSNRLADFNADALGTYRLFLQNTGFAEA